MRCERCLSEGRVGTEYSTGTRSLFFCEYCPVEYAFINGRWASKTRPSSSEPISSDASGTEAVAAVRSSGISADLVSAAEGEG